MIKKIDKFLVKLFPKQYLGLTRAQDSNDRFIFGSEIIDKYKKNESISVLDVGCGGGNFFAYVNLISKKIKYLGLDFDTEKMNNRKFENKNFDIKSQDLRNEWFYGEHDFVWSSEVIEHLFDDRKYFKKLVNSTKKNGYILITTPYIKSYLEFANKFNWSKIPSKEEIVGHVRLGYDEKDLQTLASLNEIKLEKIYYLSECNNFRSKNIFKMNRGIFCYFFNILYCLGFLKFLRYTEDNKKINKLNYFTIAAIFRK